MTGCSRKTTARNTTAHGASMKEGKAGPVRKPRSSLMSANAWVEASPGMRASRPMTMSNTRPARTVSTSLLARICTRERRPSSTPMPNSNTAAIAVRLTKVGSEWLGNTLSYRCTVYSGTTITNALMMVLNRATAANSGRIGDRSLRMLFRETEGDNLYAYH